MIVSLIVAADEQNAIGKGETMAWHLPDEMKYFRSVTEGKPVIMGRKTWESIPTARRPLPGRRNIVITTQDITVEGADIVHSVQEAIKLASVTSDECFIIGGGQIYEAALPLADRLYFTRVHTEIENADTFFPHVHFPDWREVSRVEHAKDDRHPFAFTQIVYERLGSRP